MSRKSVGLFIIAALALIALINPVSAAFNVVPSSGSKVFVGEEGLDVSGIFGTAPCTIVFFTGGQSLTDVPADSQLINPTNFYVSPSTFSGKTGVWYLSTGGVPDTTKTIYVDNPKTNIYIRNPLGDEISGKSVTRGEKINFRVETNLFAVQARDPAGLFDFKIKVENPSGVVYTALYIDGVNSKRLDFLPVNTDLWLWGDLVPVGMWDTDTKDGSSNNVYPAGQYKVSAECNANKMKDNNNYESGTRSTVKTVNIAADTLDIATNKDTITRGDQFTITVTGIPSFGYKLYVKSVGSDVAPKIISNQEGVLKINDYTADITTSTGGSRSIGFYTDKDTKNKKWTIRVETPSADKYDEVSVTVKAGEVTIVSEGIGTYYLGDEVVLTGTNTETDTVYLFMTGPNLPSGGGKLDAPGTAVVDGSAGTFATATVRDDNTYEYKWQTSNLAIDSGTYTVYAVSEPRNRDNLEDAAYDTASVMLSKPFITAKITPTNAAAGDKIFIRGDAGVETSQGVAVWIMGKNFVMYDSTSINDDGTYEYELKSGETSNMAVGQYYVVVQHPMYNDELDVYPKADGGYNYRYVVGPYPILSQENVLFTLQGPGSLQGSDAANALIVAIDNPAVDDMGAQAQFIIATPQITISPITTVTIGQEFEVKGITNLAIGDDLIIEAISSSFGPTSKNMQGQFSGFSGSTKVVEGTDQWNKFSIMIPSGNFIKDEYIVTATAITVDTSGSATFTVTDVTPTPTPTPTPIPTTVTPTTVPTTVPTTATPTPTPTESPGFGALIALIGIVGVGYLVVRKDP